ncbi:MAG: phosphatase PAP2 family protein [Acidimicrobiales bacterium]
MIRKVPDVLRQVIFIATALVLYFGVRGLTEGHVQDALDNADRLLRLEQRTGLAWEDAFQNPVSQWWLLRDAVNWIYIWGHWPVIAVTAVTLYRRHRPAYLLLRDAFFVSGAIGLVIFAMFPVAPPRLTDMGLVDTVTRHSNAYRVLQPPGFINHYAAMPSLHAGWNLLVGLTLFQVSRNRTVKILAGLSPLLMAYAVVATANHFVIDAFAGMALSMAGYFAAIGVATLRGRRGGYHDDPPPSTTRRLRSPQLVAGGRTLVLRRGLEWPWLHGPFPIMLLGVGPRRRKRASAPTSLNNP